MIETYAYARAGILGNPSDGYYGKTLAMLVRNFRARVLLFPSARLEIRPSKADMPVFENLDELYTLTRWRGYYGGIRILQALIVRFVDYCKEHGIALPDRNFTLEYESTIPLRLGMGGSSAIITAALRALTQFYDIKISLAEQAKLVLEVETKEIGVPAGPQDRVIQVFEGLVYMDFRKELMDSRGYGEYEKLDISLLPQMYMAYRTSLSEGTEVFHNDVRSRWRNGDPLVIEAMDTWASYAERGKSALQQNNFAEFNSLIDANFDLRSKLYRISDGNLEMIQAARRAGASANFAGSGGAIVGSYQDEAMFGRLQSEFDAIGAGVIKPDLGLS